MTLAEYKSILTNNILKPLCKIEWMDENEIVVDEIITDTLNGNINIEYICGMRRDCNISLKNILNKYIPDVNGYIYLNKKFKLYTGIENYWNSQGIFNLGNPKITRENVSNIMQLEGFDNFALLNGTISGKLEDDYIIPSGTKITDAVKSIFLDAGIIKSPIIYPSAEVLPFTITRQYGNTYAELLKDLSDILSWMCYFDVDGYPRFEPSIDEQNTSAIDIIDSNSIININHEYQYDKIKNYIKVYGDNTNGILAKGIAQDDGIFSETSISRIGKHIDIIEDSNIYSDDLALQRAQYELKMSIQLCENIHITLIPKDFLKEGDIILIDDSQSGLNRTLCLIKKISMDINYNKIQSIDAWKVRLI